jgi:hypothetical protein
MLRLLSRIFAVFFFLIVSIIQVAHPLDIVIIDRPRSSLDTRKDYPTLLLAEILKRTESEYGHYKIEMASSYMERERQFIELEKGVGVNVIATPSQPIWEQKLTAIKVPIDMGLQSWRVALINKEDQDFFHTIHNLKELKRLSVGAGRGWSSFDILTKNEFKVVAGADFDSMFDMLKKGRFKYFLRGVNEVFPELENYRIINVNLALEDSFIVHMPLPWLFFVSPKTPRLAKRISEGIEAMLKDGSLQNFMLNFHKNFLIKARLCKRRVFEVANPNINAELLAHKELWFNPMDPKNGICTAEKSNPKKLGNNYSATAEQNSLK